MSRYCIIRGQRKKGEKTERKEERKDDRKKVKG